jgi:hypothetical protein
VGQYVLTLASRSMVLSLLSRRQRASSHTKMGPGTVDHTTNSLDKKMKLSRTV